MGVQGPRCTDPSCTRRIRFYFCSGLLQPRLWEVARLVASIKTPHIGADIRIPAAIVHCSHRPEHHQPRQRLYLQQQTQFEAVRFYLAHLPATGWSARRHNLDSVRGDAQQQSPQAFLRAFTAPNRCSASPVPSHKSISILELREGRRCLGEQV